MKTITFRTKKIDEQCSICDSKNEGSYAVQDGIEYPLDRGSDIIEIGDESVCGNCFYQVALSIYDKYNFLQMANEKSNMDSDEQERVYKKVAIPNKLRWDIFERDNYKCLECGSRKYLTIDHMNPEINGGEAKADNLQTLCKSCNSKKGKKVESLDRKTRKMLSNVQ